MRTSWGAPGGAPPAPARSRRHHRRSGGQQDRGRSARSAGLAQRTRPRASSPERGRRRWHHFYRAGRTHEHPERPDHRRRRPYSLQVAPAGDAPLAPPARSLLVCHPQVDQPGPHRRYFDVLDFELSVEQLTRLTCVTPASVAAPNPTPSHSRPAADRPGAEPGILGGRCDAASHACRPFPALDPNWQPVTCGSWSTRGRTGERHPPIPPSTDLAFALVSGPATGSPACVLDFYPRKSPGRWAFWALWSWGESPSRALSGCPCSGAIAAGQDGLSSARR